MKNLQDVLNEAAKLPTHINGKLQPHYYFFGEQPTSFKQLYTNDISPAHIFEISKMRFSGAERLYIEKVPTYRENGTLKKMCFWKKRLMFHKAYSRTDIEVKKVSFNIVGMKRQTQRVPSGALINNIKFIY